MPPVIDKGVVYYNEKADMTITYPEGWLVLTSDELDELLGGVRSGILSAYKNSAEAEKALQQNIPVFWAFHPGEIPEYESDKSRSVYHRNGYG